jgi:hypothetical protein
VFNASAGATASGFGTFSVTGGGGGVIGPAGVVPPVPPKKKP